MWNPEDGAIREGFCRKSFSKNFVWQLTGALYTGIGPTLCFTTSTVQYGSGMADGQPYGESLAAYLGLLLRVLLRQNVVLPFRGAGRRTIPVSKQAIIHCSILVSGGAIKHYRLNRPAGHSLVSCS